MTNQKDAEFDEHKALNEMHDLKLSKALTAIDVLAEYGIKGEQAGEIVKRIYRVLRPTIDEQIVEGKKVIKSEIEELPASPFVERDLIDFVEHNCHIKDVGYGQRIVASEGKVLVDRLTEILEKHML